MNHEVRFDAAADIFLRLIRFHATFSALIRRLADTLRYYADALFAAGAALIAVC